MALTLHLGAHKTASTHLQLSLRMVREALRAAGMFYADPADLRGQGLPLMQVLADGDDAEAAVRFARQAALIRATYPQILLSEENILGGTHRSRIFGPKGRMIYPGAAGRLQRVLELLGAGPAELCLSVRDPACFNVSAFALQVAHGQEVDIGDWLMGRDPARLSWTGLARRLLSVPGVARILVWRYEDYAALRPRLLARILPPGLAGQVPEPPRSNQSLTQAGYDWLRRMTAETTTDPAVLARQARARFRPELGHDPLRLLSDADYARSAAIYAQDIARLRRLPGVEFLAP